MAEALMEELNAPFVFEDGKKIIRHPRIEIAKEPAFLSSSLYGQKFLYDGVEYEISMLGRHQIANASLAICAIKELNKKYWDISDKALKNGLKNAVWRRNQNCYD